MAFELGYLKWPDLLVIVGYFVSVLGVGLHSASKSRSDSISSYFLASRSMHWIPVGASLFASNIGSGIVLGLAGSGAAAGIGVSIFELNAIFVIILLGWVFVPVYMSSCIYTMPEYLRERLGGQRIRVYLSVLQLLLGVFTKISADLYAGALFIQASIGQTSDKWFYLSILLILFVAALFTISGGLTAVIWTDFVQTVLMLIGSLILMIIAYIEVGGYEKLLDEYPYAVASNVSQKYKECSRPPSYAMNLFRPALPGESDIPWTGFVFGSWISAIWYFCTDQVMVQRVLASKSITQAKAGCVFASFLKLVPLFIWVFPGMCARVLFPNEVACVEPEKCLKICGSEIGCSNLAYIMLVLNLLPTGLRGMMVAVMMAALMSSLTSVFNSSSSIFSIDIWERLRKESWKEKSKRMIELEQLVMGRVFVAFLVVISVISIPMIQKTATSQLFLYLETISAFLAAPISAVYILAVFWKRTNEPGAFWGLMVGLVLGIVRFAIEFSYTIPHCGSDEEDLRPIWVKMVVDEIHFLHFGCFLFILTFAVSMSVSLMTEPIPHKCLHRLTYSSRMSDKPRFPIGEWKNQKKDMTAKHISLHKGKEFSSDGHWKFLHTICCLRSPEKEEISVEKTPEQLAKEAALFMIEDERWSEYANWSAVLCMAATCFVCGFYA